jgi:hypothetical protein
MSLRQEKFTSIMKKNFLKRRFCGIAPVSIPDFVPDAALSGRCRPGYF